MTNSNSSSDWEVRLTRIESVVESNAKSIAALSDSLATLSEEVRMTNRQMRDMLRRVDDHSGDIRELIFENQRILRYLERNKDT